MEHIGWTKYCTTSTSLSDPKSIKVTPWPCRTVYYKEKPELEWDESPEQFYWVKTYASNN